MYPWTEYYTLLRALRLISEEIGSHAKDGVKELAEYYKAANAIFGRLERLEREDWKNYESSDRPA